MGAANMSLEFNLDMAEKYDLIVIGAGAAGLTAAKFAARMNARVALVEKNQIGGDCTWTGCVPSKALLKAAQVVHTVRTAAAFGVQVEPPRIDMMQVRRHIRHVIRDIEHQETEEVLTQEGIEVVLGAARFQDPFTVKVGERLLRGKSFILTTGAQPAIPPIPGLSATPYLTYQQIFDNASLPERLVVLGAGATGVEIAQAYGRLGSTVTLLDIGLLPSFDPLVGEVMGQRFEHEGIHYVTGLATAVSHNGHAYEIAVDDGAQQAIVADMLLLATGRLPNVAGLDLENAGVAYDFKGIQVDDKLRSSAKHIYAAGDCTGGFQSTHYAGWQGYKAVRNILLPLSAQGVRPHIPLAVYTDPEIAQAGFNEAQAREVYGADVRVSLQPLSGVDRAVIDRAADGFIKIVHKADGRLLGATIVAPRAGEMISEFVMALQHGLRIRDLAETIHVYPTYSMGLQRVATDVATEQFFESRIGRMSSRLAGFTVS
jgi:pyruvate/2-oxoglutarate dehydrogenase complex dihydrolipoamide dehydrogenase (E3) component